MMRDNAVFEGVSTDGLFFLTDCRNIGWFRPMDFSWNEPVNLKPLTQSNGIVHVELMLKPSKLDPSLEDGTHHSMSGILETFDIFAAISGLTISLEKSTVYAAGISPSDKAQLLGLYQFVDSSC